MGNVKCFLSALLFSILLNDAFAQCSLHIIATVPSKTKDVYVAGSFNNWDPGDKNYLLVTNNKGKKEIVLKNLPAGEYQFKLTRGTVTTLESTLKGNNITPRLVKLPNDSMLQITVAAWSDDYFDLSNLKDSALQEAMMGRAGYWVEIDLDSSYKYASRLYELAKKLNSPLKEARALDLQALIFGREGNREKALEMLLKSLAIKRALNDSSGGTSYTYGSIGKIYESTQDFANAKINYLEAAQWLSKPNERFKASSFANIGNLFLNDNNIDSAGWYALNAIRVNPRYPAAHLLMGDVDFRKGRFPEALQSYKTAAIASSRGIPGTALYTNPVEALKKIAIVFEKIGEKDSAFFYARKAFSIANKENNPASIVSASAVLIDLFRNDRRYDSAFSYQQLLMQKKDSLLTTEKNLQIHNIYFNERLNQQEVIARDEKYSSQLKIYGLAAVAVLLLLIGIGYRAKLKNRFYEQLAEIEMRVLRAQMNPHFIFNCLASINRFIVKSDTKTASAYLTKFSKLIRLILDNSSNELVSIDAEIQTLKLYLDMESLRFDESFSYEIQTGDIIRTDNTAIPAMIIQPYLENAIWHGLLQLPAAQPGNLKKGKLWLRFFHLDENTLKIEIEDNGIGRKKAAELHSKDSMKSKSYGMQISKDRIQIINNQYRTQSSVIIEDLLDQAGNAAGTKVILQLPIIEMAARPVLPNTVI